jgi:drug/metabolite transporter (DMT)-like permease
MSASRINAYILLLLTTCIWAVAAVVIKFTLDGISPLPFLTYRLLLSAIIGLFALFAFKHTLKLSTKSWIAVIVYSILSTTLSLGLLFLGLDRTTVLNLALISLVGPLLYELAGVIFLKEKLTRLEKIGTVIAFSGALFTVIEPFFEGVQSWGSLEGNLLIVGSMIADTIAVILLKKLIKRDITASALTHLSFIIGFVSILPIMILFMGIPTFVGVVTNLPLHVHLGVIYMAVMSGTIAYILRAKAQKAIDVGEAGLFGYLTSVVSAPLAVIFLKETVTPIFITGAVLIAIGVGVAEYRKKK